MHEVRKGGEPVSANCVTCSGDPFGLKPGDHIHSIKNYDGVRVGGAETHTVTYVSDAWVGFTIHSSKGKYLGERMMDREYFDANYERCS